MDKAKAQVALLALLFAVSGTGVVIVVTVAAVTGFALTGSAALATLPVALSLLGGMSATVPASHLMARRGRRAGFRASTTIALAGSALAVVAIQRGSFLLFCTASFLIGVLGGVGQLYRFAAVEVSPPERHAKAVGIVLAGGVVSGVLGPLLAFQARDFWTNAPYAGSYAALGLFCVAVLLLLAFLDVPRPPSVAKGTGRRLAVIARDPRFLAAVLAGMAAYLAMSMTMVAAPLSLRAQGDEAAIAYVIQAHVVAMFAPSFFTGSLVGRIGPARGMALGIVGLAACGAINLAGHTVAHHYIALIFLGVGWNLLFVAGTALLTTIPGPGERASVQGVNDLLVSGSSATAALTSGAIHAAHGWAGLNLDVMLGLAVAAVALGLLLRAGRQRRPAAAPPNGT